MTAATLTARHDWQSHRVILRITAPDAGTLAIETVSHRDPHGSARVMAFVERADAMVQDGTLDALYTDPHGAEVLAECFGV